MGVTAISLFTGVGGLDLAAIASGIDVRVMCEKDEFCRKVLSKNFPSVEIFTDVCNLKPPKCDLVFGGFPCQPFSVAGNRKGEKDERYLWGEVIRIVRESECRFFIGENVKGLLSCGVERVVSDLEREGFTVRVLLSSAKDFGAFHQRERIFIIGVKGGGCVPNSSSNGQYGVKGCGSSTQANDYHEKGENQAERFEGCSSLRSVLSFRNQSENWRAIPSICRVADGGSSRLDKARLKALGNMVVPAQALPVFDAVVKLNKELKFD